MDLNYFNKILIKFIEKYPFFVDPIVIFRTDSEIKKSYFSSWIIDFNYPEIDKILKIVDVLEKELKKISLELNNIVFEEKYIKEEYINRIDDFYKILKIIKIFYNEDEEEKFNLINEYFGIDLKQIWNIFKNRIFYLNYFKTDSFLLKEEQIIFLKNNEIGAEKIKFYFEEALKYLNLDSFWKIKVDNSISIVHTNFNKKWWEIIIPKYRIINLQKLLELIIHEIDWHCVQFSEVEWLYSWSIRFSKSESLLEWYSMFLESLLSSKYFWINRLELLFERKEIHYNYIKNKIELEELLKNSTGDIFRIFRWFRNIKNYSNLKDMVYLQWIVQVIDNLEKYWNFLEIIKKGVINQKYIDKYWVKSDTKEEINLEKTSAVYILNKYFIL